ncbi:hypothetical protein KOI35_22445 [Actinoplanes bogorensis]|uniref:Uncharacterized protein n=1 Tax=Paractinoplanes bogorensis TaxID=1610840 RepID=A0ABS5YS44_9ACTN|nr:hypothetical protein [Actinoplanes bogorensis]MBU2666266.1 hypothetical protein [Actinoplanes bogorensis]
MTIDLSADPPPPRRAGPPGIRRRQFLLAGACGLIGGAGGAWAIGSLVRPGHAGPVAHSVAAMEPAAVPGRFVDLATVGPFVTVEVGRSGRCSVTVTATVAFGSSDNGTLSQGGAMAYEATGANERPPRLEGAGRSFWSLSGLEVPFSVTQTLAATTLVEGLRPGRTTFTAKYRAEGGSPVPVMFSQRTITVTAIA